jgi:hypothetical protein
MNILCRSNVFTEPLLSNDREIQTDGKYAIEMGLDAMIHIPSFIKIDLGIPKLIRGNSHGIEN